MDTVEPKVFTENPFAFNFVAQQQSKVNDLPLPGRDDVVANSEYNSVGKAMGLKTPEDWNKNYDKVYLITEWAKERSGIKDPLLLIEWIEDMKKYAIPLGSKKIDRLYNNIKQIKQDGT